MALQPLAKSLLQNNPLCDLCRASVSLRPRKYQEVVSTSYRYAMSHFREYSTMPKQSHSCYETFHTAVHNGCYICNTIVENALAVLDPDASLRLGNAFEKINVVYEWLPQMMDSKSDQPVPRQLNFILRLKSSETRILSRFILETNEDHTELPAPCVLAGATDSDAALGFAKHQLSRCMEDHDCVPSQRKQEDLIDWYPNRLVDVGPASSDRTAVKVIETANTQPEGPYLTLSHCWGDTRLVPKLTKGTKAVFLSELPRLSRTFEEAISITKTLGARYIWIDSLCIIQDDVVDWAQESMLMASIYRNSLCNLAATASKNSQGGLIRQRGELLSGIQISHEFLWSLDSPQDDIADTECSPLQKRGWVLQERLLSPRILHFSGRQLLWECRQLRASETFPEGFPSTLQYFVSAQVPLDKKAQKRYSDRDKGPDWFLRDWGKILEEFTTLKLTYKSDLLPAVAGIAEHFREHTGHTYIAGVFRPEKHFEAHLAWRCVSSDVPRPTISRAPSWSWASTDNPIVLCPGTSSYSAMQVASLRTSISKVQILDVQICHSSAESQGSCDQMLVVEGFLTKGRFYPDSGHVMIDARPAAMSLFLDEPCIQERDVYILPLLRLTAEHPDIGRGTSTFIYTYLILIPSDERNENYTRLGLGRFERHSASSWVDKYRDPMVSGIYLQPEDDFMWSSQSNCEEHIGHQKRRQISIR